MPDIIVRPASDEPVSLAEAKLHMRVTDTSQDTLISMLINAARKACEVKTRQTFLISRRKMILDNFPMSGIGTPLPFEHTVNIPSYAIMLMWSPVRQVVSVNYTDMGGNPQTMSSSDYVTNLAMKPGIVTPGFGKVWPIPLPQIGSVTVTYDVGYASPITNVNTGTNAITVNGTYQWPVGSTVTVYTSGGTLPAPLAANTPYVIATATNGVYTLNDTAGNPVTITTTGTGALYLGVEDLYDVMGMRNWILIRAATLYENREEVAILQRGHIEELPFMEGLLDPFRVSIP